MKRAKEILISTKETQIQFYCPGCKDVHAINNTWFFNGNFVSPTFKPSVLVTWYYGPEQKKNVCHSFVTDGKIMFLNDCTHELAGQTVDLPPFPEL